MKPQFTEEEASQLHDDCIMDFGVTSKEAFINGLKQCGYIRKSDLEILIEEAEESYHNPEYEWQESANKLYECIQAMKAELNKRRDI